MFGVNSYEDNKTLKFTHALDKAAIYLAIQLLWIISYWFSFKTTLVINETKLACCYNQLHATSVYSENIRESLVFWCF